MNIFRTAAFRIPALALALPLAALVLAGCDVGSADSTASVVSDDDGTIYNFAGFYMHPDTDGTNIVPLVYPYLDAGNRPSGELITSLRLLQYGSVLEAYDSAGQTWSGSISALQSGTATFSLQGQTTAGQAVEIAGTMIYADQNSVMDASWIEPAYYGTLSAQATVSPATTNTPDPSEDLSLDASATSIASNELVTFTADGGDGSYDWDCNETYGNFSSTGDSATYTRTGGSSNNTETISVSSDGETESVTLDFE